MENNILKFHERKEQQDKYHKFSVEEARDFADQKANPEDGGLKHILPQGYKYSKRCYTERYYDGTRTTKPSILSDLTYGCGGCNLQT